MKVTGNGAPIMPGFAMVAAGAVSVMEILIIRPGVK